MADHPNKNQYRAPGKLLITGEYQVLKGAEALAVPTKPAQVTSVASTENPGLVRWETADISGLWFQGVFDLQNRKILKSSSTKSAEFIFNLLLTLKKMKPDHFKNSGYHIINHQEFGHEWGLGSSSSLIVNLGRWAGIDPMKLHYAVSQGSGYDVACALKESAIVFRLEKKNLPEIIPVTFNPPFKNHLYFAYRGEKVDSARSVVEFLSTKSDDSAEIENISHLTAELLKVNNVPDCIVILTEHEKIIGSILAQTPISQLYFSDFKGFVKSLGAWGGDFMLFVTPENKEYMKNYLFKKKINTWFSYDDLII